MYCGKCGKKIESTAGVCYSCDGNRFTTVTLGEIPIPCPSCALKDARIKELTNLAIEHENEAGELESRIAKLEKVVEAAKIYASMSDHAQYCGLTPFVPYEMVKGCTCGVDKLRAELAALKD